MLCRLDAQIAAIAADTEALLRASAARTLRGIGGVGPVSAIALLALMPELGRLSRRQAAAKHNHALYERLIAAGKKPLLALTAVMRKIVVISNAMLRQITTNAQTGHAVI